MNYKIQHVIVSMDFSHIAFEYALNIAKENELGDLKCLLVGPEDRFTAEELVQGRYSIAIIYFFWTEAIGKWIIIFENGIVIGQSE